MKPITLFWFRRDLRLYDNAGLYHALKSGCAVQPIFIFDTTILNALKDKTDKRVAFIHRALLNLQRDLRTFGATLDVRYGEPRAVFQELQRDYHIEAVYANRDYEPAARARDKAVYDFLVTHNIPFRAFKDHVIFEKNEVIKNDGAPYTVFTPYSRKWQTQLDDFYLRPYPTLSYAQHFDPQPEKPIPSLNEIGFTAPNDVFPESDIDFDIIRHYSERRDFPAQNGTSKLGVHLRFGTLSIRELAAHARAINATFLSELIWRDFYQMIIWQFPHAADSAFKPQYNAIEWRNDIDEFARWCNGQTGYPIVDAGMRELNATGFMHNRVRMIVASFLTKHLLIDWRWGEAYFAEKLLDFDLAANNGGWQWAAGSGCDAAPYFRVFNPYLQTEKFDAQNEYIRRWVPEFQQPDYPAPIVEHKFARDRCLAVYAHALKSKA